MDRAARKQLLLTRIALERAEWVDDMDRLQRVANVPHLVRAVVGDSLLGQFFSRRRTAAGGTGVAGDNSLGSIWLQGLSLWRRYRWTLSLASPLLPLVSGKRGIKRLLVMAVLGGGGWFAWKKLGTTGPVTPAPRKAGALGR